MDLDTMKYAELRSLAKKLGLKANMKADKLLKAIKQHYEQEPQQSAGQVGDHDCTDHHKDKDATQDIVQEEKELATEETTATTKTFVTKRRGKGFKAKRKISDTEKVVCDAKDDEQSRSSGNSKRRRVSAVPPEETSLDNNKQSGDLKDAPVVFDGENQPKVRKPGKIPRHEGLLKTRTLLKPVTPNFKKLHEAHFKKMESIDSYVQRKTKQMETYSNTVKELKMLSEKPNLKPTNRKNLMANTPRASIFSPVVGNKKPAEDKHRPSMLSATKAAQKEDALFQPSVLSTRRINVRFSEATRNNEHKRSLLKTPARLSACVTSRTPEKQANNEGKTNIIKTSNVSASKTPATFVFTGNTSVSDTPGTNKKPAFDLKASLSRPLTYKPHKGKLKPFGETKEDPEANKSLICNSHQKNYKQHKVQSRDERREKHKGDRKQKKENMLGARRGLIMT